MQMPVIKTETAVPLPPTSSKVLPLVMPKRPPLGARLAARVRQATARVVPPIIVIGLTLVVWELLCRQSGATLPPPSRVVSDTWELIIDPFFDRGGKVLWYHGWVDGASPTESAKYIAAVKAKVGAEQTEKSMRLFAMPGMGHCAGGTGCDVFDKLAELDRWVQTGVAPERIIARVSATRSSRSMPLKNTAIAKAAAWPSVTAPEVKPAMKASISGPLNA